MATAIQSVDSGEWVPGANLTLDLTGLIAEKQMEGHPMGTFNAKKEPTRLACEERYPRALARSVPPGRRYAAFVR